jgi:hypothetical protein
MISSSFLRAGASFAYSAQRVRICLLLILNAGTCASSVAILAGAPATSAITAASLSWSRNKRLWIKHGLVLSIPPRVGATVAWSAQPV